MDDVGQADRDGGNKLGGGALGIGHVLLADLLGDRHHDALVPDRGADSQRQCHAADNPGRHVLDRLAEVRGVWSDRLAIGVGDAGPAEVPAQAIDRLTDLPAVGGRDLAKADFPFQVSNDGIEIGRYGWGQ
jgi:hypothetical protein